MCYRVVAPAGLCSASRKGRHESNRTTGRSASRMGRRGRGNNTTHKRVHSLKGFECAFPPEGFI
jgi:hypothetical protein